MQECMSEQIGLCFALQDSCFVVIKGNIVITKLIVVHEYQYITFEGLTATLEASTNVSFDTDFLILLLLSTCY